MKLVKSSRGDAYCLTLSLALVILCSPALQAQEVTTELYGDFRYSYNRADAGASTHWAGANNASRLGVRAEVAGGDLTAFADLQTGVDLEAEDGGAFTRRYYLAGVGGAFGTLTLGRHSTAYKMAGLRLDPFYDTSTLSTVGAVPSTGLFAGASFGLSKLTNGWADRTLAYTSPAIHGVTANAAVYVDTASEHDYGVGLGYRGHGFDGGLQFHEVAGGRTWGQTSGVEHALRGYASYGREGWSVGASVERVRAEGGEDQSFFFAAATLEATSDLTLAAAVGHVEDGTVQPGAGTGFHAGLFYALYPQVRFHALYSRLHPDTGPDRGNLAVGLAYRFVLEGP